MASSLRYSSPWRALAPFSTCGDAELQQLDRLLTTLPIPAGRVLVRQGGSAGQFLVIGEGTAAITVEVDGMVSEVGLLGPGDFVGEQALLGRATAQPATVTAVTALTVHVCNPAEFAALLSLAPSAASAILASEGHPAAPVPVHPPDPWQVIELPGRGTTFACDLPGPSPDVPTVILLHGWMATGRLNWDACLEPLSRHYRVIALDHRGHGRGLRSRERFTLEACADDVVALADVLGVDTFVPVGYSMGGPIAQLVWRRHRSRVAGLVLVATAPDLGFPSYRRAVLDAAALTTGALRFMAGPHHEQMARFLLSSPMLTAGRERPVPEELKAHDPVALTEAVHALSRYSATRWLGDVDVPTAVIVSERDDVIVPAHQRKFVELIPGAHVVSADHDHLACFTEPDAFADLLLGACAVVAPTPAPPAMASAAGDGEEESMVRRWVSAIGRGLSTKRRTRIDLRSRGARLDGLRGAVRRKVARGRRVSATP